MNEASLFDLDPSSSELGSPAGLWALTQITNVGSVTALNLAKACSSWDQLASEPQGAIELSGAKRVSPYDLAAMARDPIEPPRHRSDTRLIGYFDLDFPAALKNIKSPPAVLWVRGTVPEGNLAAVVGTRNPTESGELITQGLISFLVNSGYGIVSGLAKGIDTCAHEQTLINSGKTWAYLGSGVDVPSPTENCDLADRIVASGGGLLSEVNLGERASSYSLVARDRLQSGSSQFTIIAQSGIPSGTLHTARFTIEQNRPLLAVAPPEEELSDPAWAGTEALLDLNGCGPEILNATGKVGERIALRRPVADYLISQPSDLSPVIQTTQQ